MLQVYIDSWYVMVCNSNQVISLPISLPISLQTLDRGEYFPLQLQLSGTVFSILFWYTKSTLDHSDIVLIDSDDIMEVMRTKRNQIKACFPANCMTGYAPHTRSVNLICPVVSLMGSVFKSGLSVFLCSTGAVFSTTSRLCADQTSSGVTQCGQSPKRGWVEES